VLFTLNPKAQSREPNVLFRGVASCPFSSTSARNASTSSKLSSTVTRKPCAQSARAKSWNPNSPYSRCRRRAAQLHPCQPDLADPAAALMDRARARGRTRLWALGSRLSARKRCCDLHLGRPLAFVPFQSSAGNHRKLPIRPHGRTMKVNAQLRMSRCGQEICR